MIGRGTFLYRLCLTGPWICRKILPCKICGLARLNPLRYTDPMRMRIHIFCILVFSTLLSISAGASQCEEHLGAVRFQQDFKQFKSATDPQPWFVNPYHYEDVHGGRPIYLQSLTLIESSLAPFLDYVDPEFKTAIALFLLKTGSIQARVDSVSGDLKVTALWLNGRRWSNVLAAVSKMDKAVQVVSQLGSWANDKSLVPSPASSPAQELLEQAALSDDYIDLFAISHRSVRGLQDYTRKYVMDELQTFMDFRTAHEMIEGMIARKMISVEILEDRGQFRVGKIRILDRYGFRTPLPHMLDNLRKWYAELNRERNLQASLQPTARELPSHRLISRIYRGD